MKRTGQLCNHSNEDIPSNVMDTSHHITSVESITFMITRIRVSVISCVLFISENFSTWLAFIWAHQPITCLTKFFLNVSLNSLNIYIYIYIFVITKGSNLSPLVWETRMLPQCQQDTCRDRIFKLSPIYASVIFPEFPEFSKSSALF